MTTATADRIQVGTFTRAIGIGEAIAADSDSRTVRFSFSSEAPVTRWDWERGIEFEEVLSHSPEHVNLGRVAGGACPLLWNHGRDVMLGKVESAELDGDRAYCTVRFSRNKRAEEVLQDVRDGIITEASFMYRVYEYERGRESTKEDRPTYRATNWEVFEISLVSIPADPSVGVGRSEAEGDRPNYVFIKGLEEQPMAGTPEKQDDLRSLITTLEGRVQILEGELTQREQAIAERDQRIAALELRTQVSDRYQSLRRQADQLRAEFKLTPAEYGETFAADPETDVARMASDDGLRELSNIEFYLGKVEKRSPLHSNQRISEPVPEQPQGAIAPADETRAQALVQKAFNGGRVVV